MKERWIVVPRWEDFQHYKNRHPPWIKDYVKQLRNDDWMGLSLSQRGLLQGLRLLYAELNGVVSEGVARRRLVGSESDARYWRVHLEAINHAGFIEFRASKPLALREQSFSNPPKPPQESESRNGNGKRDDRPAWANPAAVCPDCGEKFGHGHLEACPRLRRAASEANV